MRSGHYREVDGSTVRSVIGHHSLLDQETGFTGHKITLDSLASVETYVQQKLSISVPARDYL